MAGTLYIVATPIGNLGDLSPRARETLEKVDLIVAEDTRHSRHLLDHFGIRKPMLSMHEHNESDRADGLVGRLLQGEQIAQVSDAGTPLINDPGFQLVMAAQQAEVEVVAIPGPSAPVAALSICGLPVSRFCFEGFLPAKQGAREQLLERLVSEPRTMVFLESPRRVVEALRSMARIFGEAREVAVARELTKLHESVHRAPLQTLVPWMEEDENRQRGEFVLVVSGAEEEVAADLDEAKRVVELLATELPPRKAAALASRITGARKNHLYQMLLEKLILLAWKSARQSLYLDAEESPGSIEQSAR